MAPLARRNFFGSPHGHETLPTVNPVNLTINENSVSVFFSTMTFLFGKRIMVLAIPLFYLLLYWVDFTVFIGPYISFC